MSHFTSNRSRTIPARNFRFAIFNFQFSISSSPPGLLLRPGRPSVPPADPRDPQGATWHPPQVSDVKAQVAAWLQAEHGRRGPACQGIGGLSGISDQATGCELLDRLAETFAIVDPKVAELVEICSHPRSRLFCRPSPG